MSDADVSCVLNTDGTVDITAKQGATWDVPFIKKNPDGTPMSLSGWNIRGEIRKTPGASALVASFTFDGDLSQGQVTAHVSAAISAAIKCGPAPTDDASIYVYDMVRYQGTPEVVRKDLPHGKLIVLAGVTKYA